jgi:predicted DNA-binding transcriptional regulator AlpA
VIPPPQPHDGDTGDTAVWTEDKIRALGVITDVPTAAAIFGIGRSAAYELVQLGGFPVPVLRLGSRYRVPVAAILTALHLPADIRDDELRPPT